MLVTRKSLLTGTVRTLDLDVTQAQLDDWFTGTVAQVAFAHLPKDQREFLITGITDEEWQTLRTEED